MPKNRNRKSISTVVSNSPLQIDIQLLRIDSRVPKNTPVEHLDTFIVILPKLKNRILMV